MSGTVSSDGEITSNDEFGSDLKEFEDGYDSDLMGNSRDRDYLDSLTEYEREMELYKRQQKRDVLKTRKKINMHIMSKKKNKEIEESKSLKTEKLQALDRLKINREMSKNKKSNEKATSSSDHLSIDKSIWNRKRKFKVSEVFADDEDVKEFDKKSLLDVLNDEDLEEKDSDVVETVEQLNRIKVSRHKMTIWHCMPFFNKTMVGLYCRISEGKKDSLQLYKIYEIVKVVEIGKPYVFGDYKTNKRLIIKHGEEIKQFKMEFVSNQPFTQEEFNGWKNACDSVNFKLPSVEFIERKEAEIKKCIFYKPNEIDLNSIIIERNRFRTDPLNYTMHIQKLKMDLEVAKEDNDDEKIQRLEIEIKSLQETLEKKHADKNKQLDRIKLINERNRMLNRTELEKALKEEFKEWNTGKCNDPFTRRMTNPIMMMDKNAKEKLLKSKPLLTPKNVKNTLDSQVENKIPNKDHDYDPMDYSKEMEKLYDFDLDITFPPEFN